MNAPTTKAAVDAISEGRLAHYTDMAAQALRDNRKPAPRISALDAANETSARGPSQSFASMITVLHAYPYLGVHLQALGNFSDEGKCKIRRVQAFGDKANLYNLIPADVIAKMVELAEECEAAMKKQAAR